MAGGLCKPLSMRVFRPGHQPQLFSPFASRGHKEYADKLMSAMRYEFDGQIKKSGKAGTS